MTRNKTITKEDCHEIFLKFLHCKVDNFNSNTFFFVPRDVLAWSSMLKKHNYKPPRSHVTMMSYYLREILDVEFEDSGINYIVSIHDEKYKRKNVYKLEIMNGKSFSS